MAPASAVIFLLFLAFPSLYGKHCYFTNRSKSIDGVKLYGRNLPGQSCLVVLEFRRRANDSVCKLVLNGALLETDNDEEYLKEMDKTLWPSPLLVKIKDKCLEYVSETRWSFYDCNQSSNAYGCKYPMDETCSHWKGGKMESDFEMVHYTNDNECATNIVPNEFENCSETFAEREMYSPQFCLCMRHDHWSSWSHDQQWASSDGRHEKWVKKPGKKCQHLGVEKVVKYAIKEITPKKKSHRNIAVIIGIFCGFGLVCVCLGLIFGCLSRKGKEDVGEGPGKPLGMISTRNIQQNVQREGDKDVICQIRSPSPKSRSSSKSTAAKADNKLTSAT